MASKNREKDQAMAARLKADGDKREVTRCPICNKVVSLKEIYSHLSFHPA